MSLFQAVKERLRIVDVINEYTTLKRAGVYFRANCPFHHERTASFTVTPDREIFYCFGCRAGGDVIEFISQMEKCTPREAALHLIERYKLSIPEEHAGAHRDGAWTAQQRYFELCTVVAEWCKEQLKDSLRAQEYLRKRCVSQESIERFSIGYFPGGERQRKKLITLLQKSGFLVDEVVALRLLIVQEQRSGMYSPFEERIIFPIRDHVGRVCGFGGRVFLPEDNRPKYYNSHEHAQFSKSSLLFGFDNAKRAIQKTGSIYVVEGYLDCIAMVQAGVENVVATLGTACTEEHLRLFGRYVKRVVVMYDGDEAGVNATMRLGEICWEYALELHVAMLPQGEDPAAFLARGGTLAQLSHDDIFTFYIKALKIRFSKEQTLSDKLIAVREILRRIVRVSNALTKDMLMQQVAQICNIPLATLAKEAKMLQVSHKDKDLPASRRPEDPRPQSEICAKEASHIFGERIFCALISSDRVLEEHEEALVVEFLAPHLQALFIDFQKFKRREKVCHFSDFFAKLNKYDQEFIQRLITMYSPGTIEKALQEQMLAELLERCYKRKWKQAISGFTKAIARAQHEGDHEKMYKLLHEFQNMKQMIKNKDIV